LDLTDLGAPKVWIEFCLLLNGYRKSDRSDEDIKAGDFFWDTKGAHPRMIVRLIKNKYPCTIIGIGNSSPGGETGLNDTLYLMAWGHNFNHGNSSIWDCAKVLQAAGALDALVIDEGLDVFQCHIQGNIEPEFEKFKEHETKCEALDQWMTVPFSFETKTQSESENGEVIKPLTRRSLRASLAFWQEKRD
jgi:hypothetical protein